MFPLNIRNLCYSRLQGNKLVNWTPSSNGGVLLQWGSGPKVTLPLKRDMERKIPGRARVHNVNNTETRLLFKLLGYIFPEDESTLYGTVRYGVINMALSKRALEVGSKIFNEHLGVLQEGPTRHDKLKKVHNSYLDLLGQYLKIRDGNELVRGDLVNHGSWDLNIGVFIYDGQTFVDLYRGRYTEDGVVPSQFKFITEFPVGYWDKLYNPGTGWLDSRKLDIIDISVNVPNNRETDLFSVTLHGKQVHLPQGEEFEFFMETHDNISIITVRNPLENTVLSSSKDINIGSTLTLDKTKVTDGISYIIVSSEDNSTTGSIYTEFLSARMFIGVRYLDGRPSVLLENGYGYDYVDMTYVEFNGVDLPTELVEDIKRRHIAIIANDVLPKVLLQMITKYDV